MLYGPLRLHNPARAVVDRSGTYRETSLDSRASLAMLAVSGAYCMYESLILIEPIPRAYASPGAPPSSSSKYAYSNLNSDLIRWHHPASTQTQLYNIRSLQKAKILLGQPRAKQKHRHTLYSIMRRTHRSRSRSTRRCPPRTPPWPPWAPRGAGTTSCTSCGSARSASSAAWPPGTAGKCPAGSRTRRTACPWAGARTGPRSPSAW